MEGTEPKQGTRAPYLHILAAPLPLTFPPGWQLSTLADFPASDEHVDAALLAREALKRPHDCPPLDKLLRPSHTVCILIEDLTRTSPKHIILGEVLSILSGLGMPDEHITILIALGTHRPLTDRELRQTFGEATVERYRFVNHDCHGEDLVPIATLPGGTPVLINGLAYRADFRLGIGSIFPHPLNGFGGGGKILFPGIADARSIFEHHLRHAFRDRSALGSLDGNDFRDEIERLASAGRLDFIVNSVLDNGDRLRHVVAGTPAAAHLAGTTLCRQLTSRLFYGKAEVTVISAFPYDQGPQIMKPLAPASMITAKGGTIILYADCRSPLPETYLDACVRFRSEHGGALRQAVFASFAAGRPILADAPPELNMSMAQTMLALNDFTVILVCPGMPATDIGRLGFLPAASMGEAIDLAAARHPTATVNVVPAGGVILPVLTCQ